MHQSLSDLAGEGATTYTDCLWEILACVTN